MRRIEDKYEEKLPTLPHLPSSGHILHFISNTPLGGVCLSEADSLVKHGILICTYEDAHLHTDIYVCRFKPKNPPLEYQQYSCFGCASI